MEETHSIIEVWIVIYGVFIITILITLVTTLHKVDKKFDTGDILFLEKIPFNKKINFLNIRIFNTQICIKLVNRLVLTLKNKKKLKYKKQYLKGRYYSAIIPSVLIDKCQKNFERCG